MPSKGKLTVSGMFGLLMVFVSATLAVVSVSEIAARDSFAAFLRQHGDGLRTEYFDTTRNASIQRAPVKSDAMASTKERSLSDEIDAIRVFEQQVRILASLGAMTDGQTLEGVRRRFEQYRSNRDNQAALDRVNMDLVEAEVQLAAAKRRLDDADTKVKTVTDRVKAATGESEIRRSEYTKLVRERDAISAEMASAEARYRSLVDRAMRPASAPASSDETTNEILKARENRDVLLARLDSASDRVKRSESSGIVAAPEDILSRLIDQRAKEAEQVALLESKVNATKKQRELYKVDSNIFAWSSLWPFPKLHSDYLLALSIMACSALGALIVGLRGTNPTSLTDLTLGIASGFVCYFAIKGGKYVFLLTTHSDAITFNPYGSAFAGLLVGLFSERVYGILTALVGDLENRLQLALTLNNSGPGGATPTAEVTQVSNKPALVADEAVTSLPARLGST